MEKVALNLDEVTPGMITAESIMPNEKQIILQKNTELTGNIIALLKKWNIKSVYVKSRQPVIKQAKSSKTTQANLPRQNSSLSIFRRKYNHVSQLSQNIFDHIRTMEHLSYDLFCQLNAPVLYELLDEPHILIRLYKLKPLINVTYRHAVNVGIIAGLIGRWCGFNEQTVQNLILSGILHDVGKTQIPLKLLNKPASLTIEERETIKLHPLYGFYLLKNIPDIFPGIQYAILQHHERENGSGYPNGIASDTIHPFAKIIAIADTYDALISERFYRKGLTPFGALETLINEMFIQFDPAYCKVFIRNALQELSKATVLLNDKTQADILYFPCFMSAKPTIKKPDGTSLDLNQHPDIAIIDIIKDE